MRLSQALREIFYFPFYFVSLNMAGLLSFVRFIHGSQPASWEKGDRVVVQVLYTSGCTREKEDEDEEKSYNGEGLNCPKVSSGGTR